MTDHQPSDDGSETRAAARSADLTYEVDEDERHSMAVVRAVASLTNTPTLDLPPLYEVIDPDHLDRVFEGTGDGAARTDRSVTFGFGRCRVTVTRDAVRVRKRDSDAE